MSERGDESMIGGGGACAVSDVSLRLMVKGIDVQSRHGAEEKRREWTGVGHFRFIKYLSGEDDG